MNFLMLMLTNSYNKRNTGLKKLKKSYMVKSNRNNGIKQV